MAFSRLALAAFAAVLASTASAQQAPMSEDLVWKLLEIGRVVDPPKSAEPFAPIREKEPYQGVKTEREVKYGPAHYAERSSLQGLLATKIPLMIAAAELDPPRFVEQFNLLKQATCKGPNGCARATMVPQHSHMSEVYAINAVGMPLTDEILDFIKTGK